MYNAARVLGLKLLLLAVSFGAAAASVSAITGAPVAEASWGGMKLLHLILGTMGAGASLFFLPQLSGMALGRTVASGILCSLVGTPFLMAIYAKYMGDPIAGGENVLAAALGVGGVYLIPGLQTIWIRVRDNPWGVVDWLRGRGRGGPGSQP